MLGGPNLKVSKNYFRNIIRVSNSLDAAQPRHFFGPNLGQNCLKDYKQMTLVGEELY